MTERGTRENPEANPFETLRKIRFEYLGFSFFWAVTFIALWASSYCIPDANAYNWFNSVEKILVAAIPLAIAFIYRNRLSVLPSWCIPVAGVTLGVGTICAFLGLYVPAHSLALALVAALLLGVANALFFLLWQTFFAAVGPERASLYIPLTATISVVLYVIALVLPVEAALVLAGIVLPGIATWCLKRSLNTTEVYRFSVDAVAYHQVVLKLWRPTFCVVTFAFVWQMLSRITTTTMTVSFTLFGFACAAAILAAFALFSGKTLHLLRIYQMLFPVVTGAFLLLPFLGGAYGNVLLAFVMFGFEIVNLSLIMVIAEAAHQERLSPIVIYGISMGAVLAAMASGYFVGGLFSSETISDFARFTGVALGAIYLLSLALFFIFRRKNETFDDEMTETVATVSTGQESAFESFEQRAHELADTHGLSTREGELLELLVRGHSVVSISERLFISQNTVRGHMKNIYRKLGIHSKKELLDMIDPDR
ncbi:MAG: hypothetical protein HGA54_01215 [Actinobacteria bacterium]|nr:hypothetical protein [Actinomycetota bacterium]